MLNSTNTDSIDIELLKERVANLEKNEIQLRQDHDNLKQFYDRSPLNFQSLDEVGLIIEVNQTWLDTLQYSKEDVLGKHFSDFITQEWKGQFNDNFSEIKAKGGGSGIEFEMVRKNGSTLQVSYDCKIGRDQEGNFKQTYCVFKDITERKRAEHSSRESEKKYRLVFDNANDAIFIYDAQAHILEANAQASNWLGYTQVELLSMTIDQISTPEKAKGVLERIGRLMTQGHLIFETAHQRKNGTIIYVEVSSRRIVWNGQLAMMSICRDITKRKATEEALSKSENRLRLALKANKNAVWDWDLPTGEFYQSPFGWGMIGYEEKEIVSSHDLLPQLMHPEDLKLANQVVREAITNGKDAFKIETRLLHKHGHYVPILKRGYILRDDNKRAVRVSGTITDLTERKIFEETQGKLTRKLQQLEKVESLNCMAGAIAHNFNNLLGGVLGNLEIAIEDLPQEWGPSKYLTSAFQAAERAAEVSGTMLTYLGLSFVKHKHQDFSAICRDYVSALKGIIKNEQVLEADIPIHGLTISCDTGQIQRMLRNLVVNASEAIEGERGGICISVKTVSSADISQEHRFPVNWHPSPNNFFACLEVKDCGSGITAKDIEKIFDPFFTSKFTGRGLGLPVVLGILQSHQGGITIESELNLGSIFRCYFPLIAEQ